MKKITLFLASLLAGVAFAQTTITVTQNPTSFDQNGESVGGPSSYIMEIRNYPLNRDIFYRIKRGTDPTASGTTDWLKNNPDPFNITSATTTNAGPEVTVTGLTAGDMVMLSDGSMVQGYNVDLEWSTWSGTTSGAFPTVGADAAIVGGAGFAGTGSAINITGATAMEYAPTATPLTFTVTDPATKPDVGSTSFGTDISYSFTYTSTEIIPNLTVSLEVISFGGGISRSLPLPGSAVTLTNLAAGTDVSQTVNLTFPTSNSITDAGGFTWTLGPNGSDGNTTSNGADVTVTNGVNTNGPGGTGFNYRIKYSTSDTSAVIIQSPNDTNAGGFPDDFTYERYRNILLGTISGSAGAPIVLSVSEFAKGDVSNIVTSANPVASTIELNAEGSYSIVDLGGATKQEGTFSESINVESLNAGVYFLAIEGGVYKFVKE